MICLLPIGKSTNEIGTSVNSGNIRKQTLLKKLFKGILLHNHTEWTSVQNEKLFIYSNSFNLEPVFIK